MAGAPGSINGVQTYQLGGSITANNILSPFLSPETWDSITIGGLTWGSSAGPAGPNNGQLPGLPPNGTGGFQTTGLDGVVTTAVQGQPATPNGYVVIEGAERRFSWDPKHGKSQEGWTPTYQGTKGKQFRLKFRMWTDAQFQYWLKYRKMFDYLLLKLGSGATIVSPTSGATGPTATTVGGTVNALSVSNPKLSMLGIHSIYVEIIHELKQVHDRLEYEVPVDVWEFRPPPARNATATASGSKVRNAISSERFSTPSEIQVERNNEHIRSLKEQAAGNSTTSSGLPNVNPP